MLPYISSDTRKHEHVYKNIGTIFREVFEWVSQQVSFESTLAVQESSFDVHKIEDLFPDEYSGLRLDADSLPGNVHTIAYPFLSVVVNLNVATSAHRDRKDKGLCVVIAIGEFEDGELCLYELGLVVPLRSGDVLLFPSARITHYNIHFRGCRASIVLHTDVEIVKWTHGQRNGWDANTYYQ